ncbi:CBS domain-containing protein [Xanthobacter sp. TB0136]|uniref:CBS domain-containing protein n=1 Tax=Xanthobacter sp. TB0136 TaxID=3459177 RepID=UPI00403947BA
MTVKTMLAAKGRDVVFLSPGATVGEAVNCLAEHRIGALVLVDEEMGVKGIFSERDVMRLLAERGTAVLEEKLEGVMTRVVVTCTEDEDIVTIMERMTRGRFRHVPVVSGNRLCGIISIGDVVKHRVEEMQREHDELRTYIMTA